MSQENPKQVTIADGSISIPLDIFTKMLEELVLVGQEGKSDEAFPQNRIQIALSHLGETDRVKSLIGKAYIDDGRVSKDRPASIASGIIVALTHNQE